MNVLILTPDAVGSTLLQRLLTIYMQFHDFDRPVINLHELTNGLEKYYSPDFGREIISKRKIPNTNNLYYQTLDQIVELLSSVDHYKTSRLAQYHINQRQDPIEKQIPFYRYLDDNFFVIACRRHNLFEHALSMSLNKITKKLNVYGHREKIDIFADLYVNQVSIDPRVFLTQLDQYRDYLAWSSNYFNIGSIFYYDEHLDNIERYILNLPVFASSKHTITWKEKFDIDFNDWNRCHYIPSDLGTIALESPDALLKLTNRDAVSTEELVGLYQQQALPNWPAIQSIQDYESLPQEIKSGFNQLRRQSLSGYLPAATMSFYNSNQAAYQQANSAIKRMQELDIIVSPPPIKKQKLVEKLHMIKNWKQCLDLYNEWVVQNPGICEALSQEHLDRQIDQEQRFWNDFSNVKLSQHDTDQRLISQN